MKVNGEESMEKMTYKEMIEYLQAPEKKVGHSKIIFYIVFIYAFGEDLLKYDEKLYRHMEQAIADSGDPKKGVDESKLYDREYLKEVLLRINKPFYSVPSSPVINLINRSMIALSSKEKIRPNKNTKYDIKQEGKDVTITSNTKTSSLKLSIHNVDIFNPTEKSISNKGAKKLFSYILIKCNEQSYNNKIYFSLKDLVDIGMYTDIRNAKRGFLNNIKKLMMIQVSGSYKPTGSKHPISQDEGGVLIYNYTITNNNVVLDFNENINIDFIARYFTLLPNYAFSLKINAFSLLDYIFYLARQNSNKLKETNKFNINLRTIRDYLLLPDELKTTDSYNSIKKPIYDAIEQIEDKNHNRNFTMTLKHKDYDCIEDCKSVTEWLNGYLEIGMTGRFSEQFIRIANAQEKKIVTATKRREKAKTKALVDLEKKKLEEE